MVVIEQDFLFIARSRYLNQNISLIMKSQRFMSEQLSPTTSIDQSNLSHQKGQKHGPKAVDHH